MGTRSRRTWLSVVVWSSSESDSEPDTMSSSHPSVSASASEMDSLLAWSPPEPATVRATWRPASMFVAVLAWSSSESSSESDTMRSSHPSGSASSSESDPMRSSATGVRATSAYDLGAMLASESVLGSASESDSSRSWMSMRMVAWSPASFAASVSATCPSCDMWSYHSSWAMLASESSVLGSGSASEMDSICTLVRSVLSRIARHFAVILVCGRLSQMRAFRLAARNGALTLRSCCSK